MSGPLTTAMPSNHDHSEEDLVPGKACRVESDFLPAATHDAPHPQLAVTKGELGYAFSDKYPDWRLCQFGHGDETREGWVPTANLAIGASRVDPIPIIIPARLVPPAHLVASTAGHAPRDTLEATLCELWSAIKSNKEQITASLPGRTDRSDEVLFGTSSELWPQIIYESFQPGAIEIMKTGVFDPAELSTLDSVGPDWPQQPGIYKICYEDFDGEINMKIGAVEVESATYIGQTVTFRTRDCQHRAALESSDSTHYSIARHARKRTMVPLILFDGVRLSEMGVKMGDALDAAELTVVCLFRCWNKTLFMDSDSEALPIFANDFTAARLLAPLAGQAFQATGWAPSWTLGLNWRTPAISGSPVDRSWVGWFDMSKSVISYRSRRHIRISRDENDKISHSQFALGGDDAGLYHFLDMSLDLAEEAGLANGDVVHIIIEIKFDGEYRDHPFMYVPFPRVGRNTEFELLRSMAIRLEWEKNGSWNATYMERMHLWQRDGLTKRGGVLPAIQMGMQLWLLVTNTNYQNPPDWLQHLRSREAVQFLEYDHLAQETRLVTQKQTTKIWPPDNDISSNTDRLRHMFPPSNYPGTMIGPRPQVPDYFRAAVSYSSRTKCDLCFSQSSTRPCKYDTETGVCEACDTLCRPCTWTTGSNLNERMMTGRELSELGLSTRLSTVMSSSMIRKLTRAPFDLNLEADKKEEAMPDPNSV